MPKRSAEDPLEKVMDMMDDRKKLFSDGQYLNLCSTMKRLHDATETLNDEVKSVRARRAPWGMPLSASCCTAKSNFP